MSKLLDEDDIKLFNYKNNNMDIDLRGINLI